MNPQVYALLGLTAMVAVLISITTFAVLRFAAAARDNRRGALQGPDSAMLTAALQDAVQKLRAQERAMAERAEASERLSTHIVNSITAGLLVVDSEGRVQIFNPAGRKMLGVPPEAPVADFRGLPAGAAPLAGAIDECLRNGRPIVRRGLEMPEGGGVTHLGVTVSPFGGAGQSFDGVICLFSDLTAVVALEEQLRLKEALARLGELTAGLAHEFRNGLATIYGYGKLLDPSSMPAQFRPYVEGIRQETTELGEIVTKFLNFARPAELSLSIVDLGAVVARAAEDLRKDAQQLGGEIELRGEFGQVEGDDVMLRQAFINLLRNAVEACQEAHVAPSILVEGASDAGQGITRVSIHDNGPGVASDARERIFRPFTTTRKSGTGLGLALVQKIIVTHNGRVWAAASPRGGACFQIALPAVREMAGVLTGLSGATARPG
jgi:signal transduction histidine kinase